MRSADAQERGKVTRLKNRSEALVPRKEEEVRGEEKKCKRAKERGEEASMGIKVEYKGGKQREKGGGKKEKTEHCARRESVGKKKNQKERPTKKIGKGEGVQGATQKERKSGGKGLGKKRRGKACAHLNKSKQKQQRIEEKGKKGGKTEVEKKGALDVRVKRALKCTGKADKGRKNGSPTLVQSRGEAKMRKGEQTRPKTPPHNCHNTKKGFRRGHSTREERVFLKGRGRKGLVNKVKNRNGEFPHPAVDEREKKKVRWRVITYGPKEGKEGSEPGLSRWPKPEEGKSGKKKRGR